MNDISADKEIKQDINLEDLSTTFDPENPEGKYSLDLSQVQSQVCLQNLLLSAEKTVARNGGAFEIKQCFHQVTLNGKPKWEPPTEKLSGSSIFNLGEEISGILKFQFTLNPLQLKEREK